MHRLLAGLWIIITLSDAAAIEQTVGIHVRGHALQNLRKQEEQGNNLHRPHAEIAHNNSHTSAQVIRVAENTQGCDFTVGLDRMVLVAGEFYNLDWLRELELPYIQYQSSDPLNPHYYENNANEAGAYLRFLYDYYDCLPKVVAFIHGHGGSGWHNDDMGEVMRGIKWDSVPNFIDINRNPNDTVHLLGDARARPAVPVAFGAQVYNGQYDLHQVIGGIAYESWSTHLWLMDQSYARAFDKHFGPAGLGEMPGSVRITCCAQFVVRREAMRLRPRNFYKKTIEYLADNDIRGNNLRGSKYVVGDVLSVFWSMIFGAADTTPMQDCSVYPKLDKPARCYNA